MLQSAAWQHVFSDYTHARNSLSHATQSGRTQQAGPSIFARFILSMVRRRTSKSAGVIKLLGLLPGANLARDIFHFYFSFTGRISLKAYWLYWLLPLLFTLTAAQVFYSFGYSLQHSDMMMLPLLWPVLAISAKRLHDINLSAKWLLVHCLPFIGTALIFFINTSIPGSKKRNRHGTLNNKTRKRPR